MSALLLALACGGSPSVPSGGGAGADPDQDPVPLDAEFSSELAWNELERLASLGPRPVGSDAAAQARRRIRERIAGWQIEVEEVTTTAQSEGFGPLLLTHVIATLPGRSSDRFVLVASYDSGSYEAFAFRGVNDGASGAALLIELARALSGRERPYTVQLVWLEGEGRLGRGAETERERRWLGSAGLAERWRQEGLLDGIRLLVAFNAVCDADLRIARDLNSHRTHREDFWRAARELGRGDVFPSDARYQNIASSHTPFRNRGLRRVVAIEDVSFGGDEPPGLFAGEDDAIEHCAPESLESVGTVTLEALDAIGRRLAKIDRYSRTPTAELEPEDEPAPEAAAPVEPAPEPTVETPVEPPSEEAAGSGESPDDAAQR